MEVVRTVGRNRPRFSHSERANDDNENADLAAWSVGSGARLQMSDMATVTAKKNFSLSRNAAVVVKLRFVNNSAFSK